MKKRATQSVEPNIADLVNGWLKSYRLDYKLEQESLNPQIDKALDEYHSKSGGTGGNRPDAKLLLRDSNLDDWPVLIEYKGYKDRLAKFDFAGRLANRTAKNEPDFKTINAYAVNGAVHYANALLHYTDYTAVIAIGVTGWRDATGDLRHEIGVYLVSKSNFGAGQKVDDYTDLSFLKKKNFNAFVAKVKALSLSPADLERLKEQRDREIGASLMRLNNDIYQNEKGLSESDRVHLVAASIIATIGIPDKVATLDKSELKSSTEDGNRDGDIVLRKIEAFLKEKALPADKRALIVRTLQNTLTTDNINKPVHGESQLKRVFSKIVDDLGIYYKIGLTTDFTGKLFNEMYSWLGFTQDKLNDVVLTPFYVSTLLVRLARVDKDSYVWDFATGSAGLLVAAMNEMLADARKKIKSPDAFALKAAEIKGRQLLGLEVLSNIYMLAILNMILMGDGSSNILNRDSLNDFDGNYGFSKKGEKFPATAFVLNPPYSAPGNGMIFVERALSMMSKGYAAIIIQNSAGSGKAIEYNRRILEHSTLLASIKMPLDLFLGKSSVQTQVYVFRVGEPHQKDDVVKFIDFSNDGYNRTNRKKAAVNLRDLGDAKARYAELVALVRYGRSKLRIFTEKEYYEGHIDPKNGADWNQTAPVDTRPTLADFKKTVADYLSWEVSKLLQKQAAGEGDDLGK
jgi:type I restriction-modification system DNA methylase subunit